MDKEKDDLIKRFEGFGLSPAVCPGHDPLKLAVRLGAAKASPGQKPNVIIAETVKGFGLKCMENIPEFHYRVPTEEDLKKGKNYEPNG